MEKLKVIGSEEDRLVLATASGDRFVLGVDDVRAELKRRRRDRETSTTSRATPRDVQAHLRAGLSVAEVADLLGASRDDIDRYAGPVLAEREHIVGQALAVPVLLGDIDARQEQTFGSAVRAKLADAGATAQRWTSWKEADGWVIKLEFTAAEVDHDARWGFEPRGSSLTPLNTDATQLSRQGSLPEGLIPRLRALDAPPPTDTSRFDSGAFGPRTSAPPEVIPALDEPATAAREAATKRAEPVPTTTPDTADLLEALRRRRGQREAAPEPEEEVVPERTPAPVALFESVEESFETSPSPAPSNDSGDQNKRKRRASMPSWDEIVFGARTDD